MRCRLIGISCCRRRTDANRQHHYLFIAAAACGVLVAAQPAAAASGDITALPKLRTSSLGHYGGAEGQRGQESQKPSGKPIAAQQDSHRSGQKTVGSERTTPKIIIPGGPAEDRRPASPRAREAERKMLEKRRLRQQLAARAESSGAADLRRRIVAVATREWKFFGGAEWRLRLPSIGRAGLETQPGYRERVIHFWKRGLGRTITNTRIGWSGAFISYVMREAGAGRAFPYGGSHTWYMARTIKARQSNDLRAGFYGFRLDEVRPRPGDLVCNTLTSGITYDSVGSRRFGAHCDIVVERGDGFIKVIGGNLTNSVRKRTLLTNARGYLYPNQPRRIDPFVKRWLVVIRAR